MCDLDPHAVRARAVLCSLLRELMRTDCSLEQNLRQGDIYIASFWRSELLAYLRGLGQDCDQADVDGFAEFLAQMARWRRGNILCYVRLCLECCCAGCAAARVGRRGAAGKAEANRWAPCGAVWAALRLTDASCVAPGPTAPTRRCACCVCRCSSPLCRARARRASVLGHARQELGACGPAAFRCARLRRWRGRAARRAAGLLVELLARLGSAHP